ncbi:hypothetical protein DERP_014563 [Dermatophagoides pteronyssinus]|uniref:Uncharacterized protein n=1 Tax=Dermatophagoides pteronyssinus TaxID=6956 RepID=A0ABQ8IQF0_DERPT|nr:hypothetical protein DERP_014563 [Dermatophagoides pteronyssinus]
MFHDFLTYRLSTSPGKRLTDEKSTEKGFQCVQIDSPSYHLYRFGVIIEWLVIMSYSPALIILSYRMRSFKHWNLIFY